MQSDFMNRAMLHMKDPDNHPDVRLVLLGDYIDRGYYSIEGVLRTIMYLYSTMPSRVIALRGNHEFFLNRDGIVMSAVRPAEAIRQWLRRDTMDQFSAYRRLFIKLPTMLMFGKTLFVHGGIPRDATIDELYEGLSSLNHHRMRFEMMWSDPSTVPYVPPAVQADSVRFAFGQLQFDQFMARIGADTLIRGHQQVDEGFREMRIGDKDLVTLFSSGGADNPDLPEDSHYRDVTPMALTVTWEDGEYNAVPWEIDYKTFSVPSRNGFLRQPTTRWPWAD
jgi:hypothetical protein